MFEILVPLSLNELAADMTHIIINDIRALPNTNKELSMVSLIFDLK